MSWFWGEAPPGTPGPREIQKPLNECSRAFSFEALKVKLAETYAHSSQGNLS